MRDTPQARHSKITTSGNPLNRGVRRTRRMTCAQLGQRGKAPAPVSAFSSHMVASKRIEIRPSLRADLTIIKSSLAAAKAASPYCRLQMGAADYGDVAG
jgi:hypothetical protein